MSLPGDGRFSCTCPSASLELTEQDAALFLGGGGGGVRRDKNSEMGPFAIVAVLLL